MSSAKSLCWTRGANKENCDKENLTKRKVFVASCTKSEHFPEQNEFSSMND